MEEQDNTVSQSQPISAPKRAAREAEEPAAWRPIESAPRDGTPILAFCVHPNARYAGEDFAEWSEIVTTRWIDFNNGGWTWNGICGVHTHWMPLPAPPLPAPTSDSKHSEGGE